VGCLRIKLDKHINWIFEVFLGFQTSWSTVLAALWKMEQNNFGSSGLSVIWWLGPIWPKEIGKCGQIGKKKNLGHPDTFFCTLKCSNLPPKCPKLIPEIIKLWFSGIYMTMTQFNFKASKFRLTSTTCSDKMCPNYAAKQKKHVPKIGIKNTECSDVHVIERPAPLNLVLLEACSLIWMIS
jgi:hypothetical protein